jgi:hypothetical protein
MRVIEDQSIVHSDFLTYSRKMDLLVSESRVLTSTSDSDDGSSGSGTEEDQEKRHKGPGLSYLRIEFARIRSGMTDYLMKVSTPKYDLPGKSNVIITLRGGKKQGTPAGIEGTAKVIARQLLKKGDSTFDWENVNIDHLTKMITPAMRFFAVNNNAESMQWTTEAIA